MLQTCSLHSGCRAVTPCCLTALKSGQLSNNLHLSQLSHKHYSLYTMKRVPSASGMFSEAVQAAGLQGAGAQVTWCPPGPAAAAVWPPSSCLPGPAPHAPPHCPHASHAVLLADAAQSELASELLLHAAVAQLPWKLLPPAFPCTHGMLSDNRHWQRLKTRS